MVGFRIVLVSNGLDIYELRSAATTWFGPAKTGATAFVPAGRWLAAICCYGGIAGLMSCLVIGGLAAWRRDGRSMTMMVIAALVTAVYGFLGLELGLVIAGV